MCLLGAREHSCACAYAVRILCMTKLQRVRSGAGVRIYYSSACSGDNTSRDTSGLRGWKTPWSHDKPTTSIRYMSYAEQA